MALFYIIPFQDLVVSYLYNLQLNLLLLKVLLVFKEIIVIALGVLVLLSKTVSRGRLMVLMFFLFAIATTPFHDGSLTTFIIGLRTYLIFLFAFMIGERLSTFNFEQKLYIHLSYVFLLVAGFSFLEYFVLPLTIWKTVFPVMEMKREVGNLSTANEYYDWGIPVNAFGELTRRMLGPFDEPLYMAYFMVIILNFYTAQLMFQKNKPKLKAAVCGVLILLTQTRAILIGIIGSFVMLILKRGKVKAVYVKGAFIAFSFVLVIGVVYHEWVATLIGSLFDPNGRNRGHIDAYIGGLSMLLQSPLGQGIGMASSAVALNGSTFATENAFINLGIELGIVGSLFVFSFLVWLTFRFRNFLLNNEAISATGPYVVVAAGFLLTTQFIFAGLVAPHILTARILIPFMIIMGWCYSISSRRNF